MKSLILIKTKLGKEREVCNSFREIKEVEECFKTFGEWDIIVLVSMKNTINLNEFIINNIRKNSNVMLTSTLIEAE